MSKARIVTQEEVERAGEILEEANGVKRQLGVFSNISDLDCFTGRIFSVVSMMPRSKWDAIMRDEEVRDVIVSGRYLVREMQDYLHCLKRNGDAILGAIDEKS